MRAMSKPDGTPKTRAAIYARYSTDLQSERSAEDQIALCRDFAVREGLEVTATYRDEARSGASVLGRDGLLDAARQGRFEVVIVEALDRLSRDMEDLAGLHKRLSFLGLEIRAVHEGVASTMLVGLRGLVGQLYREDNVLKIRRGMSGRAKDGRSPGGLAYGYEPVPGETGARQIVEAEAEVVRRIFAEYLAGKSPRDIAHRLNADGIPAPRGARWNASTINGNSTRGNGILQNPLHAGRQVWNRVRMVKDPDTGRRVSRPNPPAEWVVTELPDLAIVTPEVFEVAGKRKAARAIPGPRERRRPRHLLSGLLRCGACGGGCPPMARTAAAASASAARRIPKAAPARTRTPSTSTGSRRRCSRASRPSCATPRSWPNTSAPTMKNGAASPPTRSRAAPGSRGGSARSNVP